MFSPRSGRFNAILLEFRHRSAAAASHAPFLMRARGTGLRARAPEHKKKKKQTVFKS